MKADHILVVMNGKIVEQGSHDDLIHSKGKYHDLWSKQIFVKPANSRSRSRSSQSRDPDIINDLTPNRQKIELVKALKTTQHEEPGSASRVDQAGLDIPVNPKGSAGKEPSGGGKLDTERKMDSGHKREVSA